MAWTRVRGHDHLVQAFDRVVRRGRLAHAYLFTGPPGVGKRLFAGELAKALLCEGGSGAGGKLQACDQCPSCLQVDAGTHPDLVTAARPADTLEFPIEAVREVCRTLSLKPARGRRKVAILDDADDLHGPSANCFLKTLEEPPPGSVLILVGTSEDLQLPTIISRCQVVRFAPLPGAMVAEILRGQGIEDARVLERLTRLGGGSPGQTAEFADPALWEFRNTLLDALVRPRFDSVALAQVLVHFVEEAGKEAAAQRRRAALVLRLLVGFLNDALAVRLGGTPRLAEPEDLRRLQELVNRYDDDRLLEMIERCLEADLHVDRKVQLVLALEALVDSLGQRLAAGGA